MEEKLSVVIITFNEEKNIARCIHSVKAVADDIVVVDSFSTDRTEAICLELGARFIKQRFLGHIEQKNFAITCAKYPHILSLDADEALDETLAKSVASAKKNWQADGYIMNRLTNYCGQWIRHSGWYPDRKLRLFDSRKGTWAGVNPHDKYTLVDGAQTRPLKGNLLHYSFYTISQHVEQVNKFTQIEAEQRFRQGKKPSFYHLFFKPGLKFLLYYVVKRGFLDGFYGYTICSISAQAVYLKYAKAAELFRNARQPRLN